MHAQNLPSPALILFNREVDDNIVRLEFEDTGKVDTLLNSKFYIPECNMCGRHDLIARRITSRYSDPYQLLKSHQVKLTGLNYQSVDWKSLVEFLEKKHLDTVVEINASIDPAFQIVLFQNQQTVVAMGQGVRHFWEGSLIILNPFKDQA